MNKNIGDFYDLSNIVDDDIEVVAMLLQIFSLAPNNHIISDLSMLKLEPYEKDINTLLDFKCDTLRDLSRVFKKAIEIKKEMEEKEATKIVQGSLFWKLLKN